MSGFLDIALRKASAACDNDFDFCDRVREAGFHIWTHGGLICGHLHRVNFSPVANATVAREQADGELFQEQGLPAATRQTVGPAKCAAR